MKKDLILQIKWIHSAHTHTNASDLFSIQVPKLQEGREKSENFVGGKNRLFSNERELDSPWATLEPGRQWTGKGGPVLYTPSEDVAHGSWQKKDGSNM